MESNWRFLWEEQVKTDVLFDKLDVEQEAEADDVDVKMEIVDISDNRERSFVRRLLCMVFMLSMFCMPVTVEL